MSEKHDEAEQLRVEAEEIRVENEVDRVAAEGDHDIETSRREAETVRTAAEAIRGEDETVRDEHEVRRRIAEGGPDQHVPGNVLPGRVEAEADRVAAEAERKRDEEARRKAEIARHASRRTMYARIAILFALPLALVSLIPSLIGIIRLSQQNDKLEAVTAENRDALKLLCGVSAEFDNAIVAAADQIKTSLENGTYDRLVQQGLLTKSNVDAAIETEKRYRATHRVLANPVACNKLKAD